MLECARMHYVVMGILISVPQKCADVLGQAGCGHCMQSTVRDKIISEIKEAKWYSILCDEVTDVSVKEQLSVVLQFVDSSRSIREEFLDFREDNWGSIGLQA